MSERWLQVCLVLVTAAWVAYRVVQFLGKS